MLQRVLRATGQDSSDRRKEPKILHSARLTLVTPLRDQKDCRPKQRANRREHIWNRGAGLHRSQLYQDQRPDLERGILPRGRQEPRTNET